MLALLKSVAVLLLLQTAIVHALPTTTQQTSLGLVKYTQPTTTPPNATFSVALNIPGRHQWADRDGYCGSNSIQMLALHHGVWLSQNIVRNGVTAGGCQKDGDGEEILHTNIGCVLDELKLRHDDWDYRNAARPQWRNYLSWMKRHLAMSEPVVWFVFCKGDGGSKHKHGPHGSDEGYGFYDHVEPVFAIYSNRSLTPGDSDTETYFPDDVIAHHSDWTQDAYYRTLASLEDDVTMDGNCANVQPIGGGPNENYPCIPQDVDYGYSIQGKIDPKNITLPVRLAVDSWKEPDIIEHQKPSEMQATLTVEGLTAQTDYVLLRYDGYATVPTDSVFSRTGASSAVDFTAEASTWDYSDAEKILSDTAVYYFALKAADLAA